VLVKYKCQNSDGCETEVIEGGGFKILNGDHWKEEEPDTMDTMARKDATALHARIVTAASGGVPAGITQVPDTVKDEHKGIETLLAEGQTWLYAIMESNSDAKIGSKIGSEVTTGPNAGYYPVEGGNPHTVKASAFTQRVGLEHKKDASFSGSYMGVQGTFKCTAAKCTSSPAAGDDMFTLLTGEWHFKPSDRMAKLEGGKIAEWGWWIQNAGKDNEAIKLRYAVLDDSNIVPAQTTFPAAGEATYTGKALGRYAVVDGADSESGAFEATASLTAKFRGSSGMDTELSGRIHTFDVNSDWEVMLKENKYSDGNEFAGKTVWKTNGDDGLGEGAWQATMHGMANKEPTHVVGGFTATDAGAQMIGAFGGEPPKQE